MIWSLKTRSNSQTGLGAEELLPAKLRFCFCCFSSTFSPYYHHFYLLFSFSLLLFQSSFLSRATLLIVSCIWNLVEFLFLRSRRQRLFFLEIEVVLFCFNRFMYYFYLFSSFDVSYVLSISISSSFDRQCKLEGGKRFLSISTCWTLTLGCRCLIVNWPPKKFSLRTL